MKDKFTINNTNYEFEMDDILYDVEDSFGNLFLDVYFVAREVEKIEPDKHYKFSTIIHKKNKEKHYEFHMFDSKTDSEIQLLSRLYTKDVRGIVFKNTKDKNTFIGYGNVVWDREKFVALDSYQRVI